MPRLYSQFKSSDFFFIYFCFNPTCMFWPFPITFPVFERLKDFWQLKGSFQWSSATIFVLVLQFHSCQSQIEKFLEIFIKNEGVGSNLIFIQILQNKDFPVCPFSDHISVLILTIRRKSWFSLHFTLRLVKVNGKYPIGDDWKMR